MAVSTEVLVIGSMLSRRHVVPVLNGHYRVWSVNSLSDLEISSLPPCTIVIIEKSRINFGLLKKLGRLSAVVALSLATMSRKDMERLVQTGVHEIINFAGVGQLELLSAIERAQLRYEHLETVRNRDIMFEHLCDQLPFQMAYRYLVHPDGKEELSYVSDGVRYISGLSREEVMANPGSLYDQIIPEDRSRLELDKQEAIKNLQPLEIEVRKRDKSGTLKWVHIRSSPTTAPDGTIIWDGVESDITAYRNAEESVRELLAKNEMLLESERHARADIERTGRMKDEFLAALSHELRTPINAVLGWAQLMKRGRLNVPESEKALDTIERNARIQAQLIADLLDMNRIISGKIQLQMEAIDVRQFLLAGVESIRSGAESKGIFLQVDIAPSFDASVMADSAKLQQVISNLLSNALKFTPEKGTISIEAREIDSAVEIAIRDSGVGIKKEHLPFVFERFRQADGAFSRKFGGLGLGLALVKHLTALHLGTVRADSAGDGLGATFTLALPKADSATRPSAYETFEHTQPAAIDADILKDVRVLVVDDEPDALELVKQLLSRSGAQVTTAQSANDALKHIAANTSGFDVMVSDIGMPGKDGYELMTEIRKNKNGISRSMPAIALTAFTLPEDRNRALSAGYRLHVTKPVDGVELVLVVSAVCQSKDGQAAANA